MSKYTIELGVALENILEMRAKTTSNYLNVISNCPPAILIQEYPEFMNDLIKAMASYYYYQELCTYPYGKWQIMLDGEIQKNITRYQALYDSISKDVDILSNLGYTVTDIFTGKVEKSGEGTYNSNTTGDSTNESESMNTNNGSSSTCNKQAGSEQGESSTNTHNTATGTSDTLNKFSDTPQNNVTNLENGYLTNVTDTHVDTQSTSDTDTQGTSAGSHESIGNIDTVTTGAGRTDTTGKSTNASETSGEHADNDTTDTNNTGTHVHSGKNTGISYLELMSQINDKVVNLRQIFIYDVQDTFFGLL